MRREKGKEKGEGRVRGRAGKGRRVLSRKVIKQTNPYRTRLQVNIL